MDAERWARVKEVFSEAVDLAPEEREPALERACRGDADLRREVESLLEAESGAPAFLDGNAPEFAASSLAPVAEAGDSVAGQRIGAYRLLRRIGVGGMGRVFLAERDDGAFKQRVAVKVMRGIAAETEDLQERFRAERQILANLDHPSIAKVFDGGVTEDGLPYLVMEYVDGDPIDRFCKRARAGLDQRLELFQEVCSAVQHAHRHLVVHRDLKPSNVLVSADGAVKLLDFGIAKLLEPDKLGSDEAVPLTRTGLMVMTPEYAAPEQVRREEITTSTDVYALGVVLYELLTGSRPHDLKAASPTEIERAICETEPSAPSTRVGEDDAAERSGAVESSRLRGDLDTIVLKALRKEPEERYESVRALAEDIDRYRVGLPILARPSTWTYRTAKFVRRNRYGVLAVGLVFLAVLGGLVATTLQRNRAEQEAQTARQVTEFLVGLFESNAPTESLGEQLTAHQILERGKRQIEGLADEPTVQARLLNVVGRVYSELGDFDSAEPLLRRAIALQETAGGPDLSQSLFDLGVMLGERGDLEEAQAIHRRVLALRSRARPRRQLEIASSLNELGNVLAAGVDAEAEGKLSEAIAIRERVLGPDHPSTAEARSDLGVYYYYAEQCNAAIPLFRRAIDSLRSTSDEQNLLMTHLLNNLALCLKRRGELAEATELIREAVNLEIPVYGPDHPLVLIGKGNLAGMLWERGEYAQAEDLYREVAAIRLKRSPTGVGTGSTLYYLGWTLMELGRFEEAGPLIRDGLAIREQHIRVDHPAVLGVYNVLGSLALEQGDLAAAEAHFQRVSAAFEAKQENGHPRALVARSGLGNVLGMRAKYQEAKALLSEVLAAQREASLPVDVATTLDTLGGVLLRSGAPAEAAELQRESLRIRIDEQSEMHPHTARTQRYLGETLTALGDLDEAESLLSQALAAQLLRLRPQHPQVAATQAALDELRSVRQRR